MTRAEAGLLMLCCPLGDETARPLTSAQYRALAARIRESIPPAVPDAELTENDLRRLGCDADSGARIAALLRREERLQDYLANARRRGIAVLTRLSPAYPQRLLRCSVSVKPGCFPPARPHWSVRACFGRWGRRLPGVLARWLQKRD